MLFKITNLPSFALFPMVQVYSTKLPMTNLAFVYIREIAWFGNRHWWRFERHLLILNLFNGKLYFIYFRNANITTSPTKYLNSFYLAALTTLSWIRTKLWSQKCGDNIQPFQNKIITVTYLKLQINALSNQLVFRYISFTIFNFTWDFILNK